MAWGCQWKCPCDGNWGRDLLTEVSVIKGHRRLQRLGHVKGSGLPYPAPTVGIPALTISPPPSKLTLPKSSDRARHLILLQRLKHLRHLRKYAPLLLDTHRLELITQVLTWHEFLQNPSPARIGTPPAVGPRHDMWFEFTQRLRGHGNYGDVVLHTVLGVHAMCVWVCQA